MRAIGWLLALSVAACVSPPPATITGRTATDAASLVQWSARGRLGVSAPEQSGSGAFVWQQHADRSEVSLRGPAGLGALNLTLQGATLTLQAGDGSQYDADAAMAELQQRLGVALPMSALPYWLRGLPAPGAYQWRDAAHNQLDQSGWSLLYDEWNAVNALRLPLKLTLQRDAVRVIVKVQSWQADE